ncbi:MAG: tRNA (adenosine(37)-N6)-threonylcarbamoyltransferase complex transferase subunit TsaD [Candidatus Omnitrophica bacterium]|nr:tRNA (adenosine(37)-N6)-threonylcarbamoyltransferase complex transferase subunit TsaD [Candidatus Omnitrophota bacterium]
MIALGIETSCDETAVGLVEKARKILGHSMVSSVAFHRRYGGVVPEIACRHHAELVTYCLEDALRQAGVPPSEVGLVAVTYGPGLPGALLVGLAAAKSLSFAWKVPLLGVNHLHAHLYAALMTHEPASWPKRSIGLVISGGHTALVKLKGISGHQILGQTRDDAVGEAFDKVAKLLGLGYPGGPEIEKMAPQGDPRRMKFSIPKIKSGTPWDFSFSGVKTAVLRRVEEARRTGEFGPVFAADMAASFQDFVVEEILSKSISACRTTRSRALLAGGGVAANLFLRGRLQEACRAEKIKLYLPAPLLTTDNAAMVAGLGCTLYAREGARSQLSLAAEPNLGMR